MRETKPNTRSCVRAAIAISAAALFAAQAHSADVELPATTNAVHAKSANATAETGKVRLYQLAEIAIPGAEVVGYEPSSRRAFIAAEDASVYIVEWNNEPDRPSVLRSINIPRAADLGPEFAAGAEVSHVSVDPASRGFAAASVIPANYAQHPGKVVIFSTATGDPVNTFTVGFNPDGMAFSTTGDKLVIANEGQPQTIAGVFIDPPGSITVIDLANVNSAGDIKALDQSRVTILHFEGPVFDRAVADRTLRIHPASADAPANNVEPESVASPGRHAYVTLQENNAVARVTLDVPEIDAIFSLGTIEQRIDASDRDGGISITQNVAGMPMPDQIAMIEIDGRLLAITANEGDARSGQRNSPTWEHTRLTELARLGKLSHALTTSEHLAGERIGRLYVCTFTGDLTGDGLIDRPTMLGTRSMTVWDAATFERIGDSGSAMEQTIAAIAPDMFNANPDEPNTPDKRSDRRGPEPEGVAVGVVNGRPLAFVSIERPGAVAIFDLQNPSNPRLVCMHMSARHGHTAPEGMTFIPADKTPGGKPILLVAYEHSGTLVAYRIVTTDEPAPQTVSE